MEEDCDGMCWKYLIEENFKPIMISTEPTSVDYTVTPWPHGN